MNMLIDIFVKFFTLGCISFGGPAAHIGYFQQAFVEKYKWLDAATYARIVALSQFLPGPGSSQVGFAVGHHRAGLLGAITAFVAFTLPSVILMLALALIGYQYAESITFQGVIYGLKLLAVVVVADAIITMGKSFCQAWLHKFIAIVSAVILVSASSSLMQLAVIVAAALLGYFIASKNAQTEQLVEVGSKSLIANINWLALSLFVGAFLVASLLAKDFSLINWFREFYFAGSLVFGGGHVVLPLLQETVASNMSEDAFLTGYAAAQAVPGPMFTMATYLGTQLDVSAPIATALIATIAIFLPGFLLLLAFQKAWHQFSAIPQVSGAMSAINAAVVGLLLAALYQPIAQSAVHHWSDLIAVVLGYGLLKVAKMHIGLLVLCFSGLGVLLFQVQLS